MLTRPGRHQTHHNIRRPEIKVCQAEVGKVTLKINGDEALNDEFIFKSNGDEASNDGFL